MSIWWEKKGNWYILINITYPKQYELLQHKDHPCKPLAEIPASLPGSQARPADFSPPKLCTEPSTPAINPRAFPALSTGWWRCGSGWCMGMSPAPSPPAHAPFPSHRDFLWAPVTQALQVSVPAIQLGNRSWWQLSPVGSGDRRLQEGGRSRA